MNIITRNAQDRFTFNNISDPGVTRKDCFGADVVIDGINGYYGFFESILGWIIEKISNLVVSVDIADHNGQVSSYYFNCQSFANWYRRVSSERVNGLDKIAETDMQANFCDKVWVQGVVDNLVNSRNNAPLVEKNSKKKVPEAARKATKQEMPAPIFSANTSDVVKDAFLEIVENDLPAARYCFVAGGGSRIHPSVFEKVYQAANAQNPDNKLPIILIVMRNSNSDIPETLNTADTKDVQEKTQLVTSLQFDGKVVKNNHFELVVSQIKKICDNYC